MTSLECLIKIASTIHGPRWQQPVARDLEVSDRLVRYWVAEERRVPDWACERLLNLVDETITRREADLERLRNLSRFLPPKPPASGTENWLAA